MRILSNNPARGSNNWGRLVGGRSFQPKFPMLPRRSVRRLMKTDPNNAQGTPDSQLLVGEHGVVGKSGSSNARVMGTQAQRIGAVGGTGGGAVKRIRDRGKNTSLKKR